MLRFRHFPELESRSFRTVLVGLILEGAVSGLVADRTVEWMVDEQKLQIVLLGAAHQIARTLSSHDEAIRNILGTAGHQLGEKSNDLVALLIDHDLTRFSIALRVANLDQALSTICWRRHGRVIAEMR